MPSPCARLADALWCLPSAPAVGTTQQVAADKAETWLPESQLRYHKAELRRVGLDLRDSNLKTGTCINMFNVTYCLIKETVI